MSAPSALAAAPVTGLAADVPTGGHGLRASRQAAASLDYLGGPVVHANTTHVIFWSPSNLGLSWDTGYREVISGFFANVATDSGRPTNVYSLTSQYADSSGPAEYSSSYAGALDDSDPAPVNDCTLPSTAPAWSTCLKNTDLNLEVANFIAAHGLPTGMSDLYFLVTPAGLGSCVGAGPTSCSLGGSATGSYCGWHTHAGSGASTILFANIPYAAVPSHCASGSPRPNSSTADPTLSTITHEHLESITDPLANAWRTADSQEIADLCATDFGASLGGSGGSAYNEAIGGGHYYLQEAWSNADGACMPSELPVASFSVKTAAPVAGAPVGFDASASSDADGSISSYAWQFGDGASGSGVAPTHTYAAGGTYTVTLTVSDSDGYTTAVSHQVTADELPVASFSVGPAVPGAGQAVSFNGAGSQDPDGTISSYTWSFGDGSTASGVSPTHAFARPGTYLVTLTVTDASRLAATTTKALRVVTAVKIGRVYTVRNHGASFLVVTVTGGGVLTVGRVRVLERGPGAHKFKLAGAALAALRRHRLRLKITFVPVSGPTVSRTVTFSTRR